MHLERGAFFDVDYCRLITTIITTMRRMKAKAVNPTKNKKDIVMHFLLYLNKF